MAMFKVEPAWAGYPQTTTVAGQATFTNTGTPTANTIVTQSAIAQAANANGSQVGPLNTLSPLTPKVTVVAFPTVAYKPQVATNTSAYIILLDFSGFPALLASLQVQGKAASVTPAGQINGNAYQASVLDYDQTNKLAYVQILTAAGTAVYPSNNVQLFYTAVFIDSAYP